MWFLINTASIWNTKKKILPLRVEKTIVFMKKIVYMMFFAALVLTSAMFSSCKKEEKAKAVITVLDSNNVAVFNAIVFLNTNNNTPPGIINDKKYTDNNGKTYHEFDMEAILQVEVSKGSITAPVDHIHVVPGETRELTVILKNQ